MKYLRITLILRIVTVLFVVGKIISTSAMASGGYYSGLQFSCPTCGISSNYSTLPYPAMYPNYTPYWQGYGALSYNNFYYPGMWGNHGINPHFYPRPMPVDGGGAYMAKPNLYISGPKDSQVKVSIKLKNGSNWLISVPSHGKSGWEGKLTEDRKLIVGKAKHDYFYYDYRVDQNALQDQAGFCGDRETVLSKMITALQVARFYENEVADFYEHWSVKLPVSDRYCVYPQESNQLDPLAEIKVHPAPKAIKRIIFMVQVKEALTGSGAKFTKAPPHSWQFESARSVASDNKDAIELREWGVGFLEQIKK